MMYPVRAPLLLVLLWTMQSVASLEIDAHCKTPTGESGKCILFSKCEPLIKIQRKINNTYEDTMLLTQSKCGMIQYKTLVCCPLPSLLPVSPHCGYQLSDRVTHGQNTTINEYPWMALIEYKKPFDSFGFHCGGALINERYAVTAAHCVELRSGNKRDWKVHRVRLGEWDLSSANDCEDLYCSKAPIDLDIEQIVVHSEYNPRYKINDIALIRFTEKVNFSDTVQPICLPLSSLLRERNHDGFVSWAAGWGKTETGWPSEKKLKVELNVWDFEQCKEFYKRQRILLKTTQMCAAGVHGQDTCSGDSGGPLMRLMAGSWYMIGMVSYGPSVCGTPDFPAVYTNMACFVDWIQEIIF